VDARGGSSAGVAKSVAPREAVMADQTEIFTTEQADSLSQKLLNFYEGLPDAEKIAMAGILAKAAPEDSVSGYLSSNFVGSFSSFQKSQFISASSLIAPRLGLRDFRLVVPISW
jgi:hypothetical protein